MRKGKNRTCETCGKIIMPGGMGGHMRLAHGITVKTIVKHALDICGHVTIGVCDVRRDMRDVPADVCEVPVQQTSYNVPERAVVEIRINQVYDRSKGEIPYLEGKVICGGIGCMEWYFPEELTDGLCWNCIHAND